jgi:Peptidase C13 family
MRSRVATWLTLAGIAALGACADVPVLPPVPHYDQAQLETIQMRGVLVAGDPGLPVFDNAVADMDTWLRAQAGVEPAQITRLSASPAVAARQGVRTTSWSNVVQAVESLKPLPGQGCFVFITSHGIQGAGVALSPGGVLSPGELDKAVVRGCGNAPTVVIISACFSGGFAAPPMARANRIIMTASRADRTSFGCHSEATYTFFDACLLDSLRHARRWNGLYEATVSCVERREKAGNYLPSEPQGWFGPAVADMPLPEGRRSVSSTLDP